MIAWINGFIGLAVTVLAGRQFFEMGLGESIRCVLASNVAAFVALHVTLRSERQPWIRRYFLTSTLRAWILLAAVYFSFLLLLAPPLLELKRFLVLFFPLILSTGLMIVVFGPIQDRIVARIQRISRRQ